MLHSIVLAMTLAVAPTVDVAAVRACITAPAHGCERLRRQVGACFGGVGVDDRRVGDELAVRLAGALIHPAAALQPIVRRCARGDDGACRRLGDVAILLFSGGDAALDRSSDRELARALAHAIVDRR